jgi:hypothetical protein
MRQVVAAARALPLAAGEHLCKMLQRLARAGVEIQEITA